MARLVWAEMLRVITSRTASRDAALRTRNLVRRRPTASYGELNCRHPLGLPLPGLALPDDITVCIDY